MKRPQMWSTSGQCQWNLGHQWPNSGQVKPPSPQIGSGAGGLDRTWRGLDQVWVPIVPTKLARVWPIMARIRPTCSGQLGPSVTLVPAQHSSAPPQADSDGDGWPDCVDRCPADAAKTAPGVCGCNSSDVDSDLDGTPDCDDRCPGPRTRTPMAPRSRIFLGSGSGGQADGLSVGRSGGWSGH